MQIHALKAPSSKQPDSTDDKYQSTNDNIQVGFVIWYLLFVIPGTKGVKCT